MSEKQKPADMSYMPNEATFQSRLSNRKLMGQVWRTFFIFSIVLAIAALLVLFTTVTNSAFGSIATTFEIEPSTLTGDADRSLSELSTDELVAILIEYQGNRLPVLVRDNMSSVPDEDFTGATLEQLYPNGQYPEGLADVTINDIRDLDNTADILGEFMGMNLSKNQLVSLVEEDIVALQVLDAWSLWDAINNLDPSPAEVERIETLHAQILDTERQIADVETQITDLESQVSTLREEDTSGNANAITDLNTQISDLQDNLEQLVSDLDDFNDEMTQLLSSNITTSIARDYGSSTDPLEILSAAQAREFSTDDATIELVRYHSWLDSRFLFNSMSSVPAQAGIRTALFGSIIMMIIVILVSLPVGVAAAIYLEEYAKDNFLARVSFININKIIETNVRNLAGVPSIIYGMLGLAIFVRLLAPVTSGVAFGVNVVPPPPDRIVNLLEEPENIEMDIELDDNYNIISYTGPEWLPEDEAQDLVAIFRRLGTPSITNTGNIPLERTEEQLANFFGFRILDSIPDSTDPIAYSRIAAGFVEIDSLPMSVEEFEAIAQQLRRITGFTVSGRTILSAALTLSLLILPVIIINSQEALRAVPNVLREASYGLGATKWQTIWKTVLPAAVPGIMTGTILAVSRAVGETAPLIVVGASTFLLTDPNGPFSQFTVLPIQIYQWTARPQGQFEFIAAAAIIVLLSMVLILNAVAIIIRNRFTNRF